jgi:hypothetical protein
MIAKYPCGKCGVITEPHPVGKDILIDEVKVFEVPKQVVNENNEVVTVTESIKRTEKVPVTKKHRMQCIHTGKIREIDVPLKDYGDKVKGIHVSLRLGEGESINKMLCPCCYDAIIRDLAENLFKALEKLD